MKKYMIVVSALVIISLFSSTLAFAADFRSLAIWMVCDENGELLQDATVAALIGDPYRAYVVALSKEISENKLYYLFSSEQSDPIPLKLVEYTTDGDSNVLGLFKVDSSYAVTCTELAQNADYYYGSALLQSFDYSEEIAQPSDMIAAYRQEAVSVVDHEGSYMMLDREPDSMIDGAAVLNKDGDLLGFYWKESPDRYNILSTDLIVECFPQLQRFCAPVRTTEEEETTNKPDETETQTTAAEEKTEAVTESKTTTKSTKEETTAEAADKEPDQTDDSFMKDGLGLILIIAGAVILAAAAVVIFKAIAGKDKSGAAAADAKRQVPREGDRYDPYGAAPYHADDSRNRPDGRTQVKPVSDYPQEHSVTVPLYPTALQIKEPIRLIGRGGRFDKQVIQQTGAIVIGRHPKDCTLVYPPDEKGISTVHCRLERKNGDIVITDLSSRFGTFVNGIRLAPNDPTVLIPGDTFWLAIPTNSFFIQS